MENQRWLVHQVLSPYFPKLPELLPFPTFTVCDSASRNHVATGIWVSCQISRMLSIFYMTKSHTMAVPPSFDQCTAFAFSHAFRGVHSGQWQAGSIQTKALHRIVDHLCLLLPDHIKSAISPNTHMVTNLAVHIDGIIPMFVWKGDFVYVPRLELWRISRLTGFCERSLSHAPFKAYSWVTAGWFPGTHTECGYSSLCEP